ncbi:hypothetical protein INR49_016724 [Caranx melampygus]|nr:hypothetical protein INR49_016724 [Caranx melampygus]
MTVDAKSVKFLRGEADDTGRTTLKGNLKKRAVKEQNNEGKEINEQKTDRNIGKKAGRKRQKAGRKRKKAGRLKGDDAAKPAPFPRDSFVYGLLLA